MEFKTELEERLAFDSLQAAEDIMGKSYKEDESVVGLGMLMMFENNARKKALLQANGDSCFSNSVADYLQIIRNEGFEKVFETPVEPNPHTDGDTYFIFWHPDGILLSFDTYNGKVNGGKFYYNWKPSGSWKECCRYISSGGFKGDAWVGDHDCREAIRHNIRNLRENGEFLPIWAERPFLWLLHYMDSKAEGYDYKAITESRIALLPKYVQTAITPS